MDADFSAMRPLLWRRIARWTAVLGPGLMVMLADTDAGSIITAAQSGAQWGYRMVLPQILLIPILFFVQEMTVRLGVLTGKGHGELIRDTFGRSWAMISVGTLFVASLGAIITEFAGIAGVAQLFGVSAPLAVIAAAALLIGLGLSGSYRKVERVGIALGLFELFFLPAALLAHPQASQLMNGLTSMPLGDGGYLFLLAANIGAVIMPWMVFYQQGAVIDKGLAPHQLRAARLDTLLGAAATQVVMICVVVAVAATIGRANHPQSLTAIPEISRALEPFLGYLGAKLAFGLGILGASLVAALVVSLAGAFGLGEALGKPHSLNSSPREAKLFYLAYAGALALGAAAVLSGAPLVRLTIDVEVMNAILLPVVLGFLVALEARALPAEARMRGLYRIVVWASVAVVIGFGLFTAVRVIA
ncbi:MAG: divalent metal cation transporter [Thermaerobacter sp.]|nr:divalent metal cation transporter [Thermaerobacter sp.]